MSSSKKISSKGTVIVTTGDDVGLRFLVLAEHEIGFEERGRAPTLDEQASARAPYECKSWVNVIDRVKLDLSAGERRDNRPPSPHT